MDLFSCCSSVSPALCVRFMTKRFIGEYDNKKGETVIFFFFEMRILTVFILAFIITLCKYRGDLQMQPGG